MDVRALVSTALRADPDRVALEFEGRAFDCRALQSLIDPLCTALDDADVPRDAPIALLARNRPAAAAVLLGLIEAGRPVSNIYAFQSAELVAADLRARRYHAVIAEDADWNADVLAAVAEVGSVGLSVSLGAEANVTLRSAGKRLDSGAFCPALREPGIEILSSGTTGPPKRVLIPTRILARAVESIAQGGATAGSFAADIVLWPIAGIGGACCLIGDFALQRQIVLLEKFQLGPFLDAVQRHQVPTVNAPPAVLRAIVDADVPRAALGALRYVFGGSAPLSVELQEAFEAKYDIPVIWAYGATEFCGTLTSWTPALYEAMGAAKRGSIGRAIGGVDLRIVDGDTGEEMPTGRTGYIEARSADVSTDWIRTTDLAFVDADGFYFHQGRGDGAIVRGGFKITPERIDDALRSHPAISDAATVAMPDHRLGEVPVSAVELIRGIPVPTSEDLDRFLRSKLAAHHIPVRFLILDALPRTTSLKPALGDIKALFAR